MDGGVGSAELQHSQTSMRRIAWVKNIGVIELPAHRGCADPNTVTRFAMQAFDEILTNDHGLPVSRAGQMAVCSRNAFYRPFHMNAIQADEDAPATVALTAMVVEHVRWDFWTVHVLGEMRN
jgi:hypothetical protein